MITLAFYQNMYCHIRKKIIIKIPADSIMAEEVRLQLSLDRGERPDEIKLISAHTNNIRIFKYKKCEAFSNHLILYHHNNDMDVSLEIICML